MSSSNGSTVDQSNNQSRDYCRDNRGPGGNWSGTNIAVMVLSFVFFWPFGLFVLYWILRGRDVRAIPQAIRRLFSRITGFGQSDGFNWGTTEDNVVFNEYQQTQFDRINEIKDEIRERSRRFREYRADARRRADEEEFNRFMADTPMPE